MKTGLVLEGGAMRGMFTAGVLDAMMNNNITVDGTIGVSAGATFAGDHSGRYRRLGRLCVQRLSDRAWTVPLPPVR